jgi:acetyl esterase/lipase
MRKDGQTVLPKPIVLPHGLDITIPTRAGSVDCRLFYPSNLDPASKPKTNGIILHIHGGGWVLMDQTTSDPLLKSYADGGGCTVISVGYRLAPEHPFPAGPEDCYDAAEYLVKNGEDEFGGPLRFIGGEVRAFCYMFYIIFFHALARTVSSREMMNSSS